MYRGTGVSRGVRRTTWERSLKIWELQIACSEEFLGGENILGLVPASLPHTLGHACTFYAPTSPPPTKTPRHFSMPNPMANYGSVARAGFLYPNFKICDFVSCSPRGGTGGAKPGSGVQRLWGPLGQESPRQTKPKQGQFMNFSQGHSGTKVQCESCLFS